MNKAGQKLGKEAASRTYARLSVWEILWQVVSRREDARARANHYPRKKRSPRLPRGGLQVALRAREARRALLRGAARLRRSYPSHRAAAPRPNDSRAPSARSPGSEERPTRSSLGKPLNCPGPQRSDVQVLKNMYITAFGPVGGSVYFVHWHPA